MEINGYSRSEIISHIKQYCKNRTCQLKEYNRHKFQKKYTNQDIKLLAKSAQLHDSSYGAALKKTLECMAREYSKEQYLNISHTYNLKKYICYLRSIKNYQKTNKVKAKAIV
jgi:hypothetical protein